MEEIAWKILTEQGIRIAPDNIIRDIGSVSAKIGIPKDHLGEFSKAMINEEYGTELDCSLSNERRNEIALLLIKSRYNSKDDKISPEEARKARGILAGRIGVDLAHLEAFSRQIMAELYEMAFSLK
ncbi:MAG: hypothetical protein PHG66_02140 [Candidatus Colwellbacteria bacterium]|nr:hypothetical protein [Candidatus Colwellbacteria bacterium]